MPEKFELQTGHLWGKLVPDKLAFNIHDRYLVKTNLRPFQSRGYVSLVNAGGSYWYICIHAEGLVPGIPFIQQVAFWLAYLSLNGVFRADVAWSFLQVLDASWDWQNPALLFTYFETLSWFEIRESEKEVAADFKTTQRPVKRLFKAAGKKFKLSLYSLDQVQYKRNVQMPDGTWRWESKAGRKSLVCEYDRAAKIGAKENLWRLELRLQRHHLDRLSIYDLCLDFHTWYFYRLPLLAKFLRKAVKPGTWGISEEALEWDHWGLRTLLEDAGWFFS